MTMKMRGQLLNRNTRGGTEKEKADGRRAKKPTRGGGRTEAPDTNYKARTKAYLGTRWNAKDPNLT